MSNSKLWRLPECCCKTCPADRSRSSYKDHMNEIEKYLSTQITRSLLGKQRVVAIHVAIHVSLFHALAGADIFGGCRHPYVFLRRVRLRKLCSHKTRWGGCEEMKSMNFHGAMMKIKWFSIKNDGFSRFPEFPTEAGRSPTPTAR